MIPKGTYRARAESAQYGTSPNKGTDFVHVAFAIVDGEHAGSLVPWDGYFTEKTSARTIEAQRHCGCTFPGTDVTDTTGLGSADVQIVVEHETYEKNGEARVTAKVQWVNSLAGGVSPELQMDAAKKAAFKARMMGQIVASASGGQAGGQAVGQPRPNGAARPAPAAAPAVGAAASDDIPF